MPWKPHVSTILKVDKNHLLHADLHTEDPTDLRWTIRVLEIVPNPNSLSVNPTVNIPREETEIKLNDLSGLTSFMNDHNWGELTHQFAERLSSHAKEGLSPKVGGKERPKFFR